MGTLSKFIHRNDTTDILEILTAQHKEVDELIEKIESGDGPRRQQFMLLGNKLAAHATAEEKVFYPAVMAKETEEMLQESVEEHLAIKRLLADLMDMRLDDDSFKAKLSVLKEQIAHHAHEEEEDEMFPVVKRLMSEEQRAAIGNEFLVMFEELIATNPLDNVPAETDKAAKLPSP